MQPVNEFWPVNRIQEQTFFFKYHVEKETGRIVLGPFLFFKKALYEVKASGLRLSFNIL